MSNTEPTPFEKFREFAQQVVRVPKSEIDKREAEYRRNRAKRKVTRLAKT